MNKMILPAMVAAPLLVLPPIAPALAMASHAGPGLFQFSETTATGVETVAASKKQRSRRPDHRLFRPHVYTGQVFGRSAREATGDPNIVVFDRRHEIGDVYRCSYITYRGKRAVVCD